MKMHPLHGCASAVAMYSRSAKPARYAGVAALSRSFDSERESAMTWGEFKEKIDGCKDVNDDLEIEYIDFNSFDADHVGIEAYVDKGTISIH